MHVDKHVVKMILEYCQLLSTAHRVLDGQEFVEPSKKGRMMKRWLLPRQELDLAAYKATHVNHPSAVWVRQSVSNYLWLSNLLVELCKEYTHRYGKVHKCESSGLVKILYIYTPLNFPLTAIGFTQPTPAMPDKYKVEGDSIASYRNYYIGDKQRMASWKNRPTPEWWKS